LEQESKPEVVYKVERDLLTKQIEQSALANEKDDARAMERKGEVDKEVDALQKELDRLQDMWMAEKDELERGKKLQEQLDAAKRELTIVRKQGKFCIGGAAVKLRSFACYLTCLSLLCKIYLAKVIWPRQLSYNMQLSPG
jgi:ATP-dependent Clp protease ATP-binding subunit ClpB